MIMRFCGEVHHATRYVTWGNCADDRSRKVRTDTSWRTVDCVAGWVVVGWVVNRAVVGLGVRPRPPQGLVGTPDQSVSQCVLYFITRGLSVGVRSWARTQYAPSLLGNTTMLSTHGRGALLPLGNGVRRRWLANV